MSSLNVPPINFNELIISYRLGILMTDLILIVPSAPLNLANIGSFLVAI